MAGLAIGGVADSLVVAAVGPGLVAVIAIELLAINRRNIGGEVSLMIESQDVRIARMFPLDLEFGMSLIESGERLSETAIGPG